MLRDGVIKLIDGGVINNNAIHPNKSVLSFAIGSKKLYNYLDDNPAFTLLDYYKTSKCRWL